MCKTHTSGPGNSAHSVGSVVLISTLPRVDVMVTSTEGGNENVVHCSVVTI